MAANQTAVPPTKLEPWDDLSGKVVMVTGASSGIGWEFCIDLAKAGCKIVAAARRLDRLKSLCDEINGLGSMNRSGDGFQAVAVQLDVAAEGSTIEACVRRGWDAFGHIDVLINNAGVRGNVRNPLELSEEEWNSTMKTNLDGTWLVTKYVCTLMRDAKRGGSIINISSISGLNRVVLAGGLAYACSKSSVITMTKVMALELGMYKIRVNCISPGLFKSEITEKLMQMPWLENFARRTVPLRNFHLVDPALTRLARYLIHDSSSYVNGNNFIVDSGGTLPGVPLFSSL